MKFVLKVFSELSFCDGTIDVCELPHNTVAYITTRLTLTTTTTMDNKNKLELVSKKRGCLSVLSCINMRSSGLCIRQRTCPLAFFERGQYCPAPNTAQQRRVTPNTAQQGRVTPYTAQQQGNTWEE